MKYASQIELAKALNLSSNHISKLKARGFFAGCTRKKPGRSRPLYHVEKCRQALQKRTEPQLFKKTAGCEDYLAARTENHKWRGELGKLNLEIRQGKWIERAVVRDEAFNAGRIFRDRILNIGPRYAAIFAGENDEQKCQQILEKEFTQALDELKKSLRELTR